MKKKSRRCAAVNPILPEPGDIDGDVAWRRRQIEQLLGEVRDHLNNRAHGLTLAQAATRLAEEGGPEFQAEYIQAYSAQGNCHIDLGEFAQAITCYSKVCLAYQSLNDQVHAAYTEIQIGIIYARQGLYPEALRVFFEAKAIYEERIESGMSLLPAEEQAFVVRSLNFVLNNIGFTYTNLGEPEKALPYCQQVIAYAREYHETRLLAVGLDSLGRAYLRLNRLEEALSSLTESLEICRAEKHLYFLAEYLGSAAAISLAQELPGQALDLLNESFQLAREIGARETEAETLHRMAQTFEHMGQLDQAISHEQQALALAREIGVHPLIYQCLHHLAGLYKQTGSFERALECHELFYMEHETILGYQTGLRLRSLEIQGEMERTRKEKEQVEWQNERLKHEIEERIKAQRLAEELAITDPLTHLGNRRHFFHLAELALTDAARCRNPLAVLLFDIDLLKQINDRYGHSAGDSVLVAVASLVRREFREADIIARYGGDEFVILMPETGAAQAAQAAASLCDRMSGLAIPTRQGPVSCTLSIGIASLDPSQAMNLEDLLRQADQALYQAKAQGRNCAVTYSHRL